MRQPGMQPVPGPDDRRTVEASVGVDRDIRFAPGAGVTEDELAAVATRPAHHVWRGQRGRAAQNPVRAHPHQHRDRQVGQLEGQSGTVVAGVGDDQDLAITRFPVPVGDQSGDDPTELVGGEGGGVGSGGESLDVQRCGPGAAAGFQRDHD